MTATAQPTPGLPPSPATPLVLQPKRSWILATPLVLQPKRSGSIGAAVARLRRAGRLPAVVVLPYALVSDRLDRLAGEPDTEAELEQALARLAGQPAPEQGAGPASRALPTRPVSRATTARSVADPTSRRPGSAVPPDLGGLSAASQRAGAAGRTQPAPTLPTPRGLQHARSGAGSIGASATRPTPSPVTRRSTESVRSDQADQPDRLGTRLRGGSNHREVGASPTDATYWKVPGLGRGSVGGISAGRVQVRRDPELLGLLDRLAHRDHDPRGLVDPVLPPRSRVASPAPVGRVGPQDRTLSPRSTQGSWPIAGLSPAAEIRPESHPHPSAPSVPAGPGADRLGGFATPPVGLAGLVGWWQARSADPDATPGPGWDATSGSTTAPSSSHHGPTETAPLLIADHAYAGSDELRDAIERLLLDEALADGLEVSDGPA